MKKIHASCIILSVLTLLSLGIMGSLSADQAASCPKGMTLCNGTHCADLMSDEAACGACGNVCPAGLSCNKGVCGCEEDEMLCDGKCVEARYDASNCGKCGNVCPSGQFCNDRACTCAIGNIYCNGTCIDKYFDDNNCGACGNVCPSGTTCSSLGCVPYSG